MSSLANLGIPLPGQSKLSRTAVNPEAVKSGSGPGHFLLDGSWCLLFDFELNLRSN